MQVKTKRAASVRRAGNDTAARIVLAARELLMTEGYAQFSMRNVAARAGLHLANVQYDYKTREDLVTALLNDTGERYRTSYQELRAKAPTDREARFKAIVEYNLKDIATAETRRYFIQLWALLTEIDAAAGGKAFAGGKAGHLMNDLYAIDIQQLSDCIADLVPDTDAAEVRRRASILAAMIEGMVVVRGAHSRNPVELKKLMARAQGVARQIALGLVPDVN
jgi:AcrR family transcriptional regulator